MTSESASAAPFSFHGLPACTALLASTSVHQVADTNAKNIGEELRGEFSA
jgi:hypothetical protein